MARKAPQRMFLTEWYARSKSFSTTINAMRFVCEYGRACDRLGRELTIEEYAEEVGASRSQAFRRQSAFRTCSTKQDVASVWEIVRPILDASNFRDEGPKAQAVFAASIKVTWTVS